MISYAYDIIPDYVWYQRTSSYDIIIVDLWLGYHRQYHRSWTMILCMISSSWIYDITTLNVWYQRTYDIIGLWYHKQYHIMVLDHDIMHDIIILELWYHHPESMISGTYDIIDLWYHRQYYRFWTMISCMISYTCNLEVQELAHQSEW